MTACAQGAHRGHGSDAFAAPGIDGVENSAGLRSGIAGAAQQFGHALALGLGLGGLGRLGGRGFDGARVRNRIALAEDFHGEVPHDFERNGEAREIGAAQAGTACGFFAQSGDGGGKIDVAQILFDGLAIDRLCRRRRRIGAAARRPDACRRRAAAHRKTRSRR